ncbi:MAG: hypothetical protein E7136_01755 [Rikenellaceae bacterium]|nr:hypothetical protein [Rikenellaceae bacterium]
MKKYISYMAFCLLALLTACNTADLVDLPSQGNGRITLSFTTQGNETRAVDVSSVGAEAKVTHIDLFIVKSDGSTQTVKHERLTAPAQGTKVTLTSITKKDLQSGTTTIYGVANSTKSADAMADLATNFDLAVLQKQIEQTDHIHLTGSGIEGVPEAFLMWGQAEYNGNANISVATDATGDVDLDIELVRAAAKVTINFKLETSNNPQLHGFGLPSAYDATNKKITDLSTITYTEAGSYYLRNMPYKSYFAESFFVDNSKDNYLRKTNEIDYGYYNWQDQNTVTVTAYVYSYEWDLGDSSFENEPTMIVNLPAVQIDNVANNEGTYLDNNYYEIPLRMPKSADPKYDRTDGSNNYLQLKRNHHYVINATVNAPGSKSKFEPMEIKNIHYAEYDWTTTTVDIGGDGGAEYLSLNTYDFDMRNIATDNSTLKFYSSSPLTNIELLSASYIDKYGQTVQMINNSDYNSITNVINATYTNGAITGPITINSPLPENDAIRSMRFRVTNEDGLTQEFTVDQYPVITITNQQAYFSYRLDFETYYTNLVRHSQSGNYRVTASWDSRDQEWSYGSGNSYNMFASKYAVERNNGRSYIYYYYRNNNRWVTNDSAGLDNARIYHVTINATSADYIVARPKMTSDGYTDDGADNAKLVSPSFMIASQLGATLSGYDHKKAKQHCKQYVEVYLNDEGKEVHLTGWRLPTDAEIKIITERQYQQNAAVDEVLSGRYYHSASGRAITRQTNDDGTYTRCIRDHFEEVAPKN